MWLVIVLLALIALVWLAMKMVRPKTKSYPFVVGLGVLAIAFIIVLLVLPAVQQRQEATPKTLSRNHLHQISIALHRYHDAYGCFPAAAVTDGHGQPIHSWTVYLLPFLDEPSLYNAYNFAQPHDAPANSTVGATRVDQFCCPDGAPSSAPVTHYGIVVCPGSIGGVDRYTSIKEIKDGPAMTLLVAEMARTPVPWTAPRAVVDPARGINVTGTDEPALGSSHGDGCLVLTADGQIHWLAADTPGDILRALSTMAGGEIVPENRLGW